ncbi:MAG: hypothetical protein ACE37K_08325 [Planctomycetota bacterium]
MIIIAASLLPFLLVCLTDALGWTEDSNPCGLVVLAAVGASLGAVLWLVGLFVRASDPGRDGSSE